MRNFKKYILTICMMIITSVVSLFMVSMFTYLFKWQADKAMIGIIVTYVLTGFVGGLCLRRERKVIGALGMGTIFVFLLVICSCIGFQIPFEFSRRFLLIWLLITSSTFGGMCVKRWKC